MDGGGPQLCAGGPALWTLDATPGGLCSAATCVSPVFPVHPLLQLLWTVLDNLMLTEPLPGWQFLMRTERRFARKRLKDVWIFPLSFPYLSPILLLRMMEYTYNRHLEGYLQTACLSTPKE